MKKYFSYIGIGIVAVFIIITPFFLQNEKEYQRNLFYMNTYIDVKVYSKDPIKAETALNGVEAIYREYHELTDRYNETSELSKLNHSEKQQVDPKLYQLIQDGINWHKVSHGKLNINLGTVVDIWKKYRDQQNGIPTMEELKQSGSHDINNIVLLDHNEIQNKGFNLDLGSTTKGYATGKAGEYLKKNGISNFLINAGGNVLAGGSHRRMDYKIGIESPNKDGSLLDIVHGTNFAVVTSGSYERFYEYEGVRYHHIIDPNTLFPSTYMKSVTVVGPDSGVCDALSTILFLMPVEEGKKLIATYGVEAIWVLNDDTVVKSKGFTAYE